MADDKKPRRDFAIHMNEIHILGRVSEPPKRRKDKKVGVPILVPAYKKGGGRQWVPYTIDVTGEDAGRAIEARVGDYFEVTCQFAQRAINDDNGERKTVVVLQHHAYRPLGIRPGNVGEDYDPMNPPLEDVCFTRVVLAGRNFIRKKQLEEGKETPILRGDEGKEFCFVNLKYEDPFAPLPTEGYPESIFLDFALSGNDAKHANEHCRNRAQIMIVGELGGKKEANFTVRGKTPKEPKISVLAGGFRFNNLTGGGGKRPEPKAAEGYDADDTEGLDLDDDLPV